MNKYEKWNETLEQYFTEVTEEQLVKDADETGITLIKLKRFKVKSMNKPRKRFF